MVSLTRSIIGKAIFGVCVVAITDTAGVAGFASAARHHSDHDGDGYGGYGGRAALIQAAVDTFNMAVADATSTLQSDIASCVANSGQQTSQASGFRRSSQNSAADFSARTDDPTEFSNMNQFSNVVSGADSKLGRDIDSASGNLTANLDRNFGRDHDRSNNLNKCIKTADNSFKGRVRTAEAVLKSTLRSIFS